MEQDETNITMSVFPFLIIYFYYLIYIVGDKTKIKIHCPWKYCEKKSRLTPNMLKMSNSFFRTPTRGLEQLCLEAHCKIQVSAYFLGQM